MNHVDDPIGGWKVGDRVVYVPKYSFDATYHRGVIVEIEMLQTGDGEPVARFTVQGEPEFGFGRVRLQLSAIHSRW